MDENIKKIEIKSITHFNAEMTAPPSKAHTLRILFIAALAKGKTAIKNPLIAEDQKYTIDALRCMGVKIDINKETNTITIEGCDGRFKVENPNLFIGNSGVAARFLPLIGSLSDKDVIIDGVERMRTGRPMQDLLDAIKPLGIEAKSLSGNGCPPVFVKAGSFIGGTALMKGDKSSQYFSAILLAAPFAKKDVEIKTEGKLVSKPYIDITIDMMKDFGVDVKNNDYKSFEIKSGQHYNARNYDVEGDFSGASFFFEATAIMKGRVKIKNLYSNSSQGDKKFVDFLEMMGCSVTRGKDFIELSGKELRGIRVDMCDYPDIVIPLMVVAAFAKGKTEIYNVSHLQYKESDRINAPITELKKMGINASYDGETITVVGGTPHAAEIDTYKDHRMAMSFAVASLKTGGVINNPDAVNKSFPDFFDVLDKLTGCVKK